MNKVYLGIPCYGNKVSEGTVRSVTMASKTGAVDMFHCSSYSLLPQNFNMLYCDALNQRKDGITHFAMLHDDIIPEPFWLDKMLLIMGSHRADALCVVVPVKDSRGVTSTAIDAEDANTFCKVRRVTMTEAYKKYKPTFTHPRLLLNTGCLLIDLSKPWVEKVWFHFENRIVKDSEGQFKAEGVSEDWAFSRMALKEGARLFATREISVLHEGLSRWGNQEAWGSVAEDL